MSTSIKDFKQIKKNFFLLFDSKLCQKFNSDLKKIDKCIHLTRSIISLKITGFIASNKGIKSNYQIIKISILLV